MTVAKTITNLDLHAAMWSAVTQKLSSLPIKYRMKGGQGKVKSLDNTPITNIKYLDCSGYVQYVLYKTTYGSGSIPQGSSNQQDYFKDNDFLKVDYATNAGKIDNILRIAFKKSEYEKYKNDDGDTKVRRTVVGHVWFVFNGMTFESTTKGPNNGPASMSWDKRTSHASLCYNIGSLNSFEVFDTCSV